MRKILIGLGGQLSSGKDTVSAYLVEKHGFKHISTGDMIRFYIAEHGMGAPERDLMLTVGTTLREEHGADYLVRMALENEADKLVVSGIRAITEAQAIKDAGGVIIACTAPIEVRYERLFSRGRDGDNTITLEKFREQEEREMSNTNPEAQNIRAVIAMADTVINNSGTLEDLQKEVDSFCKRAR